jgi:hypothetical protein
MKNKHSFNEKRHKQLLLVFLVLLMSALVILPSGCLDKDTYDQQVDATESHTPDAGKDEVPEIIDVSNVTDEPQPAEEPVVQTIIASTSGRSGSSGSSSPSPSPHVSRSLTGSGDYTEPTGTITGDLTITGDITGTITLPVGLTVNGNLNVNTPGATVNNYATVGGTINIIAVSVNTWNQYGNAGNIQMGAPGATFYFFSGNITQGVSLTNPCNVVINASTYLPLIIVTEDAEGSDIENLGSGELNITADGNITVAGNVNVTGSGIPVERTARGSLALSPASAVYNTNIDMEVTYTIGEDLVSGNITITIPGTFTLNENADSLNIAGSGATTVLANADASYNSNVLTVENLNLNKNDAIVLTLSTQSISDTGTYDFAATAQNSTKLTSNAATARFTSLLNNNANLSALAVSFGTLDPVFSSSTIAYTVNVTYDVSSFDVTATLSDPEASILISGESAINGVAKSITLEDPGEATTILVVVTAEDTSTTKIYNIIANRGAVLGEAVTGLDDVLQLGETTTASASTIEAGAGSWTSSTPAVATVSGDTGVVNALTAGTTTIGYTTSTSGNVNSKEITVYAAATVSNPTIGVVQVGEGDVTPTGFTAAGAGETIAWLSSVPAKATVNAVTGVITPVEAGDTTISYAVVETSTGKIVAKGSLEITVQAA